MSDMDKVYVEQSAVLVALQAAINKQAKKPDALQFISDILDAPFVPPPADVAPVLRGRWALLSYDEALCTNCGYVRGTPFECTKEAKARWDEELPPFCEMCGADMRKEAKDER